MSRDDRYDFKDMSVLRESDPAFDQSKSCRGFLKDYSLQHTVEVLWDLSEESIRDRVFKIRIGDNEALIDAEELLRLVRWV